MNYILAAQTANSILPLTLIVFGAIGLVAMLLYVVMKENPKVRAERLEKEAAEKANNGTEPNNGIVNDVVVSPEETILAAVRVGLQTPTKKIEINPVYEDGKLQGAEIKITND